MEESLLIKMIERVCIAATLAFILSQTNLFRRINYRYVSLRDKIKLTIVFGVIGIIGTYAGIPIDNAYANSRVIGVMAAGFIGGPVMGIGAGVIAGSHRYMMGGFTAFSCALANLCEGLLAGLISRYYVRRPIPWWAALVSGVAGETMQMGVILLTARPFSDAMQLVGHIALPMIVANSIGLAIFMLIIKTTLDVQKQEGAVQAQKSLLIAAKTLPHFRRGLNAQSAEAAAKIVYEYGGYHAVAVTDTERVLAFIGAGREHHLSGGCTKATQTALHNGSMYIAMNPKEIGCRRKDCPLKSAIIVPLKYGETMIGTIKLYYTAEKLLNQADVVFAGGLAQLFSVQLELAEIEFRSKQAAHAELKALQAQINPHFLFNTLNTITSLVRTKPALARELLVKLSEIFRFTLHKTGKDITLAEELAQVHAYLAIEKARHGEKLQFSEDIALNPNLYLIPSMTIQPMIENAVQHGLRPKPDGGTIWITAKEKESCILISVIDDGAGFDLQKRNPLQNDLEGHIGVRNVHERLRSQYGKRCGLEIESTVGKGTAVTIVIPKLIAIEGDSNAQHTHRR